MNNFIVTIGIEVHTALNTKSKMFSNAKNSHTSNPNTLVSFMDLGLPGILPTVNKQGLNKAIILADALNMDINYKKIIFDRKNYFYLDLPKGFQITQQYYPIGTNGYLDIEDEFNNIKKIELERIHIEEDTAKQTSVDNKSLMDFNRAGSPLIEIVTKPCISSGYEAMQYLQMLRRVLIFKDISDAKMEEGSMRADVNISVRLHGQKELGTKVEIKNINSINNVAKAIDFEIIRQTNLLLNNKEVNQETRRFNDSNNQTEFLRSKSNAVDYRYMTEPNIMQFSLEDEYIKNLIKNSNPSVKEVEDKLKKCDLSKQNINLLLDNYNLCSMFLEIINKNIEPKLAFNWITVELIGLINKLSININDINTNCKIRFFNLLSLLDKQEINSKQAKLLLDEIFKSEETLDQMIARMGFVQIKDKNLLSNIIDKYIKENEELVAQYEQRPERVEKFLVGMVMKETNSQANPVITFELVKSKLSNI